MPVNDVSRLIHRNTPVWRVPARLITSSPNVSMNPARARALSLLGEYLSLPASQRERELQAGDGEPGAGLLFELLDGAAEVAAQQLGVPIDAL